MKLPSALSCDWEKACNCVRKETVVVVHYRLYAALNARQHTRYFTVVKILSCFWHEQCSFCIDWWLFEM